MYEIDISVEFRMDTITNILVGPMSAALKWVSRAPYSHCEDCLEVVLIQSCNADQ